MGWGPGKSSRAPPAPLPDGTVADILLRLPSISVIISGAVCKAWRRVTTDPLFLESLARRRRRRTTWILVHTLLDAAPWPGHAGIVEEGLELAALPVSAAVPTRRRLMRYLRAPYHCLLLASCQGVILFKKDPGHYLLCNPATRQWAQLPLLHGEYRSHDQEYAFFFHEPSGEFRLLCRNMARRIWFVVSTGAAQPRRLENIDAAEFIPWMPITVSAPVVPLHGNLHWSPHQTSLRGEGTYMVVFDVSSETFHRMAGPPVTSAFHVSSETFDQMAGLLLTSNARMKLFEMNGLLVAADFELEGKQHIDLWFLEDYGAARWERRHRIACLTCKYNIGAPAAAPDKICRWLSVAAAGDGDEESVILGNQEGLVVYDVRRSKVVRTVMGPFVSTASRDSEHVIGVTRHVFKESLVRHACFGPSSVDVPLIHEWC